MEYLNRIVWPNGNITVKLVKMGMDIDSDLNHRVRGIVQTDDGKHIFIEISLARRPALKYLKNMKMNSKEFLGKYPFHEYIYVSDCFRVDDPEDYLNSRSVEFDKYCRSYYEMEYTRMNIVRLLQQFNKNIEDVRLVKDNYIDDYCKEMGFHRADLRKKGKEE